MHRETVRPERLVAGGDALGHLADGRIVFIPGLVPGDVAEVEVTDERRDFARAVAVALIERSSDRVEPACPAVARGCGGCDWQHISTEAQQRWKMEVVREALRRTARLPDAELRWGGSVPPWGYRTTLRLGATPDGRLGLRAARSNDVVSIERCPVAHDSITGVLDAVRLRPAAASSPRRLGRGERRPRAERDEVTVRVSSRGGATVAAPPSVLARLDGVPSDVAVGDQAWLVEDVGGRPLRVSGASFFQSGPAAATLLVGTVASLLADTAAGRGRRGALLDAYGGVGLFAVALGWERSVVVEASPLACDDARHSLGDSAVVVNSSFEAWDPATFDGDIEVAIVDPARDGLGAGGVATLGRVDASVVVLVSCDPVAMARDVAALVASGYRHRVGVVLDLFPQTHHVEVVTLLER